MALRERWTPLDGGKHAGKTLPQVVLSDPNYFFYGFPGLFETILREANKIHARATNIIIPGRERKAVYFRHEVDSWRFAGVVLLPRQQVVETGQVAATATVLDLSVPHRLFPDDKAAGQQLIRELKELGIPGLSERMTKPLCESFFSDESRFAKLGPYP